MNNDKHPFAFQGDEWTDGTGQGILNIAEYMKNRPPIEPFPIPDESSVGEWGRKLTKLSIKNFFARFKPINFTLPEDIQERVDVIKKERDNGDAS